MNPFKLFIVLCASLLAQQSFLSAQTEGVKTSPEKTKLLVQDHVTNLAKSIETAKAKLQQATSTPEARQVQFDEMITTIQQAIVETGDGGEIFNLVNAAIQQSEMKLRDYKNKMSDPDVSNKTQLLYQQIAEKFKKSNNDLLGSKLSLSKKRAELEEALKMAEEQKTLFIDMIQADELLAANEAVKQLAYAMTEVSNSINDMASEMGTENPAAPVLR